MAPQGKFIVFEGPDGSGQTTQAKRLAIRAKELGWPVILTKEPTLESSVGSRIRDALSKKISVEPAELQRLFVEDRRDHLERLVLPALADGYCVISDRYYFSTFAYGALACDMEWLIGLNRDFRAPDMTFVLAVRPAVCVSRIKARGSEAELFEKESKLAQVLKNYKKLAKRFPLVHVIDGEESIEDVAEKISAIAVPLLRR